MCVLVSHSQAACEVSLILDNHQLQKVSSFRYLECVLRGNNRLESEMAARIARAAVCCFCGPRS